LAQAPGTRPSGFFLIGAAEQHGWDGEAERLGGLEIDDQIELGRLRDWRVGGFGAPQDVIDV
jgi:hypothetical protein